MKTTLFFLLFAYHAQAQIDTVRVDSFFTIKTSWETVKIDPQNEGNPSCLHIWIGGPQKQLSSHSNHSTIHPIGFHCPLDDNYMERICAKCLRRELQREVVLQKKVALTRIIKPDFDSLARKLNPSDYIVIVR